MTLGLLGTKLGMTREFVESGQSVPVTVIKVEKGRVLDIISKEKRGYSAVKIGFFIGHFILSFGSFQIIPNSDFASL